jgi:membrane protein
MGFKSAYKTGEAFISGIGSRRLPTYAAAGTYYLFLSLVPIVMLLCSLLPLTSLTQESVLHVLSDYVPASMIALVERIIADVYRGSTATLTISIVLTVWSASASLRALMRGMDAACDTQRHENVVVFFLRSFFYMVALLFVILISLAVMVYGGKILSLLQDTLPYVPALDFLFYLLRYLRFVLVMVILAMVFSVLYHWIPAACARRGKQWPGALFSAVIWVIFSSVFSFYISFSDKYGTYGIIGTVMVAMMWMFFCLYFLLIGAYLNRYLELRREQAA